MIEQIERIADTLKADRRESFEPPYTTLNVGMIKGGTAKNIVAGECRFTLEWRTIPGQASNRVLDLVTQSIDELKSDDAEFVCEIDGNRFDESFETSADSPLVKFLEAASVQTSGAVAFGTEAPSMISLGADGVVFGPGDIRVAHRTGEFVPVDQLNQCAQILRQAIEKFCG